MACLTGLEVNLDFLSDQGYLQRTHWGIIEYLSLFIADGIFEFMRDCTQNFYKNMNKT